MTQFWFAASTEELEDGARTERPGLRRADRPPRDRSAPDRLHVDAATVVATHESDPVAAAFDDQAQAAKERIRAKKAPQTCKADASPIVPAAAHASSRDRAVRSCERMWARIDNAILSRGTCGKPESRRVKYGLGPAPRKNASSRPGGQTRRRAFRFCPAT